MIIVELIALRASRDDLHEISRLWSVHPGRELA